MDQSACYHVWGAHVHNGKRSKLNKFDEEATKQILIYFLSVLGMPFCTLAQLWEQLVPILGSFWLSHDKEFDGYSLSTKVSHNANPNARELTNDSLLLERFSD